MSATVDRSAAPAAPEAPGTLARVEGLELLGEVSGSGYKEGAALVRRADGQMVQLGPLMYGLLEEIDGERDNDALAAAMSERLGRALEAEHVARIGEKLAEQGLLAGSEDNAPPRMNPLLALRWKVLFTDPNVTRRITAPFEALFRPWIVIPAVVGFLAVCWFVLIHQGVAAATSQAFDNPELLLLVLGLTIASAALHEIGHAAACRYGGGRPGGMGAGIYIVWPAFYTDVTDAYRLPRVAPAAHRSRRHLLQRRHRGDHARRLARHGRRRAAAADRAPDARDRQEPLARDPLRRLPHPVRRDRGAGPLRAHGPDAASACSRGRSASRPR